MTLDPNKELFALLHAMREGTISEDQLVHLKTLLRNDRKVRWFYVRYMILCANLSRTLSSYPIDMPNCALTFDSPKDRPTPTVGDIEEHLTKIQTQPSKPDGSPPPEHIEKIRLEAQRRLDAFLAQEDAEKERAGRGRVHHSLVVHDLKETIHRIARKLDKILVISLRGGVWAAGLLALGLTMYVTIQYALSHRVVATLGDSMHARWEVTPTEPALRPGWMTLQQGFAELTFKDGAKVILQAPCELRLESPKRLFLESGSLTARANERAVGFTVRTPSSQVVDYGTEFGVAVGDYSTSEVQVFEGKVQVKTRPQSPRPKRSVNLTIGQAVTTDASGEMHVDSVSDHPHLFVRQLPVKETYGIPGKRLDLADVVAGGNGLGIAASGLSMGLAGDRFTDIGINAWSPEQTTYQAVKRSSFIDGIFLLHTAGGPIQVDSTGHTYLFGGSVDLEPLAIDRTPIITALDKDPDLVAWWSFDGGSGTIARDYSGNGNDGIINGGAQWVRGKLGNAMHFNGVDAWVQAPSIPLNNRSFTITMWVAPVLHTDQVLISQTQTRAMDTSTYCRIYREGRVRMGFRGNDLDTSHGIINGSSWVHLAFRYDDDKKTREIYINAKREAMETDSIASLASNGDTIIGSWGGKTQYFKGIIDDTRIYNRVLTQDEIRSLMLGRSKIGPRSALGRQPKAQTLPIYYREFGVSGRQAIGMQSNAGVSFDLAAMRTAFPGVELSAFNTQCILDNKVLSPDLQVEVFVLVDGQLRWQRFIDSVKSDASRINIVLTSNDQFLTLVCRNAQGYSHDGFIFVEPHLELRLKN